jgi:hypothetical protein
VKMTRLFCHRYRANEVRLWLSLIAYNLGNLWWRLALATQVVSWFADQLAAASVENRRAVDKARPLLLVAAAGEPPHTAAVRRHAAQDHGLAGTGGIYGR